MDNIAFEIINKDSVVSANNCVFGRFGGIIGSGSECQLIIQDNEGKIAPKHCQISFSEGDFVLSALNGDVFYNGAFSAIKDDEIALNIGDTIKIGNIELVCINANNREITPMNNEKILDKVDDFSNLDEIKLAPIGQISNAALLEKDRIKDVIDKTNISSSDITPQSTITKDNLLTLITNSLQDSKIPQMLNGEAISINQIEAMLDNEQLVESKKLINLLVLSILLKELDSPIFAELQGVEKSEVFMDYISSALNASICGKKDFIEALVIKALKSYVN